MKKYVKVVPLNDTQAEPELIELPADTSLLGTWGTIAATVAPWVPEGKKAIGIATTKDPASA